MRIFISIITFLFANASYAVVAIDKSKDKAIASLASEPIGISNYLQMFFGLFIVVALVFGMAWLMKRLGGVNSALTGDLKVLGAVSVGQRERVVLVQAGETQILVGVAPGAVRALHVLDKPITQITAVQSTISSGFAEKLHAAIKNRSRP